MTTLLLVTHLFAIFMASWWTGLATCGQSGVVGLKHEAIG